MKKLWIFIAFLLPLSLVAQDMTMKKMGKLLKKVATEIEGEKGFWAIKYEERQLLVVTDDSANRMRIFTPVVEQKELKRGELERLLEANFHSALDAKYSLYDGLVISVFTHLLKELTEQQVLDALFQVATLADTFGTTYSSTLLIFGGEKETENKEEKAIVKEKRS